MTHRIARLALAAVVGASLLGAAPPASAATGTVNPPALWYKIAGEITDADAVAAASRYRVVILQSWQKTAAARIKSLNPAVTVLAYKDLSSASYAEAALYNERNGLPMATGVGYLDAVANGWLALDTTGQPVVWDGYPNLWQMEVWNPAYQQRWVDNVTREMAGSVFDGVFGDDALTTLRFYSDATLAEAPTDAALQAGEQALISQAATALRAMGKKLVLNIPAATDYLPVWTTWSQMTDGAMYEHFAHWGTDPNSASNYLWDWGSRGWTAGVAALATSPGNVAVTTSADTDDRSYRYGLASFLLATGGHGAFTAVDSYKKAPWRPEQSWDLGYATTPAVKAGAAYTRAFPNGFVAVNPSKDQTVTVTLPGPLTDVTGATVTSATLPPLTGALFKGVPSSTSTTTTTTTSPKKGKWRHHTPFRTSYSPAAAQRTPHAAAARPSRALPMGADVAAPAAGAALRVPDAPAASLTHSIDTAVTARTRAAAPAARPSAVRPATAPAGPSLPAVPAGSARATASGSWLALLLVLGVAWRRLAPVRR